MRYILLILFAFVAIGINAQVETIPTVTGSNSGDGEIKAIVASAQANDNLTEDRIDSSRIVFDYSDSTAILTTATFENGATISNTETDTFYIEETVTKITGELVITGHVSEGQHAAGLTYISTPGTQTIGTGGTFERLNEGAIAYTSEHLHEFTHSDGRLTYTSVDDIDVTISCAISVTSDETTQLVQFRLAKNGSTLVGTNMAHDFTATARNATIPIAWLEDLAQNDYIEVFGTSDTNGDTFILNNLTLAISKH